MIEKRTTAWFASVSAYWFATSFKWFILLLVVIPGQVQEIVPGGTRGQAWGSVVALGATWAIIGPSIFGYLSDRIRGPNASRAPYIALGSALTVVALVTLMEANQLWVIALGYMLLQFSDDVGTGPYSALIPELVSQDQRGKASGWMSMAMMAGQISVGLFALAVSGDIQTIYIGIAVVNILGATVVLLALRGVRVTILQEPTRASPLEFAKGWLRPWSSSDFFWVWFTRFLIALGFYMVVTYLRFFMEDRVDNYFLFGIDLQNAGTATNVLALTISLMGIMGSLWAGPAADRIGRKKVIYLSGVVMAPVILPSAFLTDYQLIWLLSLLFGVGYGMFVSADWALASDVLPDKNALGQQMGVWQMSVSVVQIFAGLMGTVVDAGNRYREGGGYQIAFLMATVCFLCGTILVYRIKGST